MIVYESGSLFHKVLSNRVIVMMEVIGTVQPYGCELRMQVVIFIGFGVLLFGDFSQVGLQ